jgi:hypothetical protein
LIIVITFPQGRLAVAFFGCRFFVSQPISKNTDSVTP